MKKIYFIGPLTALALFAVVFWNFKSGHREREKARVAELALAKEAKLKSEVEARQKAIADALVAQEARKKEREAKDAREQAEKNARLMALDAREKAHREQEKLSRQLDRLTKELVAEKATLAKLQAMKTEALAEQIFLREFVSKAEGSAKKFEAVLARMESAERERERVAAAPESTKKKS